MPQVASKVLLRPDSKDARTARHLILKSFVIFDVKSSVQKEQSAMVKVTIVVHPSGLGPKEAGKAWYS